MAMTLFQDSHRWDHLIQSWTPGIDRLSPGTWILVAAYFVSSFLCLNNGRTAGRDSRPGRRWFLLGAGLSGLGFARLLSLESLITVSARNLVVRCGWYDHRSLVQIPFLVAAIVSMGALALLGIRTESIRQRDLYLATIGTLGAAGVFAVRACSFHYTDLLIGLGWGGIHLGGVIEFGCIALTAIGASHCSGPRDGGKERA